MPIQTRALGHSYLDAGELPSLLLQFEGYIAAAYDDGRHIPTIGIGINIDQNNNGNLALVLQYLGVFAASDNADTAYRQQNGLPAETLDEKRLRYQSVVSDFRQVITNNPLSRSTEPVGTSPSEQALRAALDQELQNHGVTRAFSLSETEAQAIKSDFILGYSIGTLSGAPFSSLGAQSGLDSRLMSNGTPIDHDTQEYKALMSLYFNNPSLIGDGLLAALREEGGNRAKAWFEIRYQSNRDTFNSKRRYAESEIFGLYNTPGSATIEEARQVDRMYTEKLSIIETYENRYQTPASYGGVSISSLADSLLPTRNALLDWTSSTYNLQIDPNQISPVDVLLATDPVQGSVLDGTYGDARNAANVLIGEGGNDELYGGTGDDWLIGGAGADRMDGGAGVDTMVGGAGNDVYWVDASTDVVTELPGEGLETVNSRATYTLSENIENLTLLGASDLNGTGNSLDNVLTGNNGTNILSGGAGNDIYILGIFSGASTVVENANEGIDTVQSPRILTQLSANVENLIMEGTWEATGWGNELPNMIIGSSGSNFLNGEAGADTLIGGLGDDRYLVDNPGDVVTEQAGEGVDEVQSLFISWTLSANVENLWLVDGPINGHGNELDNTITGNPYANVLDGGAGADTLIGAQGDDTYVVDNAGDVVTEQPNEGIDTVQSPFTYTLGANVENLTLTAASAINGNGNTLDNVLIGNSAVNTLTGDAGNDTLDGQGGADIMLGGSGDDSYYVDNAADVVTEGADEGTETVYSSSSTYTLGSNVENLMLTGAAALNGTGNNLINAIYGNSAANVLDGGANTDAMVGGQGDDTYIVDNTFDGIQEQPNEGTDTVLSSVTYGLLPEVENLTLTGASSVNGTGNTLDNVLIGNSAVNTLTGDAGNDTLDGQGGADTMLGGSGNDVYYVDNASDVVTENASQGTDSVYSSITYTLGSNVENITLIGNAGINGTGNSLDNIIIGNSANNSLTGGAGTDTLNGGTGADSMSGGTGNDTYYLDDTADVVTESNNQGTDSVNSSISYTLGSNVENLVLLSDGGAINGTGNSLANTITGNASNNVLDGGSAPDTMIGGQGDDTYVVDNNGDVTTEQAGEGIDTVQSSKTWTLAANIENLSLTGTTGINGTGNTLDNVLTGNSGTNTLSGGTGNDTYVVGSGDTVTESASAGTDTVQSSVTFALGTNVENLILTGATAINGTGNTVANLLRGNSAINTLTGAAGIDVLEGAGGDDTLSDSAGSDNGYFNGGLGNDVITGGSGREFYLGGAGNDTLNTGTGADIIAYNRGNGQDTVNASTALDNVLSLGGGIAYSDLIFRQVGSDLILDTGAAESITFKSWYTGTTNKSVLTLQVIAEAMAGFDANSPDPLLNKKVQTFDFSQLAGAFDAARAADPTLTSWALTNGLAQFHLSGSDTDALGGDLAYQYGENASLAGIGFNKAQDVLASPQFGTQAQTLRPLATLQDGFVPLG